jgi:hypothetical protein
VKTKTHLKWLALAVLPAAVLLAGGCSSAHRGAVAAKTTTSTTATTGATTSTASTASTASTTPAPPAPPVPTPTTVAHPALATPSGPGFDAALRAWRMAPRVNGSAEENVPLLQAVTDLTNGLQTDRGTSGYQSAIAYLKDMTGLPVSDPTAAQEADFKLDITVLDSFFATPGLWGPA